MGHFQIKRKVGDLKIFPIFLALFILRRLKADLIEEMYVSEKVSTKVFVKRPIYYYLHSQMWMSVLQEHTTVLLVIFVRILLGHLNVSVSEICSVSLVCHFLPNTI